MQVFQIWNETIYFRLNSILPPIWIDSMSNTFLHTHSSCFRDIIKQAQKEQAKSLLPSSRKQNIRQNNSFTTCTSIYLKCHISAIHKTTEDPGWRGFTSEASSNENVISDHADTLHLGMWSLSSPSPFFLFFSFHQLVSPRSSMCITSQSLSRLHTAPRRNTFP